MTFDNLVPEGRRGRVDEGMFKVGVSEAKKFAEEPNEWMVLEGRAGTGKTHLAAAIVNAIVDRGSQAIFISALDIPDLIHNERFQDVEVGMFESLLDVPTLAIDDFGAQQAADWIDSRVDQLLTHRFNSRLPTVIVLAKPISEMPERISQKLCEPGLSTVVRLTSDDSSLDSQRASIPKTMLERMTFEKFLPNGAANIVEQETLDNAYKAARDFVEKSEKWLYLHGPTGRGKTHLAVSIANAYIQRGVPVTFWSVPNLLDALRHSYSSSEETSFYSLFATVRDAEVLILDDFGSQRMTDWALEKLYQIISHRYDLRLPTVITSQYVIWQGANNRQWEYLRDNPIWESIVSRLSDSQMITERLMSAPDYRNRGA